MSDNATDNNNNNKMIQIISPLTGMPFKIELNGDELCLRELLGTILEIPPLSIKGIKDIYNNYYTLSSALKSKNINNEPNNFYTIITENIMNNNDYDLRKYSLNTNNFNSSKDLQNNMYYLNNRYINDDMLFFPNNRINNIQNIQNVGISKIRNNFLGNNFFKNYNKTDYYYLINFLYKNNYIDNKNYYKLQKCIDINNQDVMEIMRPFIEFDDNYDKLINNLFPILNLDLTINEELAIKNNNNNSLRYDNYKQILYSLKEYFQSNNIKELSYLLLMENIDIIKIFKLYLKTKNKQNLINDLYNLLKKLSKKNIRAKSSNGMNKIIKVRKSKSQNYTKISKKTNEKTHKDNKTINKDLLNEITNKIIDYGKHFTKDILYLIIIELNNLTVEDKNTLFKSKFNINVNTSKSKKFELNNTNKKHIKNYYNKYIKSNIYKFLDEEEKKIYDNIIKETHSPENQELMQIYSEIAKNKNNKNKLELLRNKIINYLKEIIEHNKEGTEVEEQESRSKETNKNNKESKESKESEEEDGIIKIEANEEDDQEDENNKDKNEEKESSQCSSTVMDVEDENNENYYDNQSDESGVSIRKANRPKKN